MKLLRRFIVLLCVGAYLAAASLGPLAYASPQSQTMAGMQHEQGHDCCDPRPGSKDFKPGCFSELGCIFLISIVPPALTLSTTAAWSAVRYEHAADTLASRSIPPALGPPISRA